MSRTHEAYLAAHNVIQTIWGAVDEAPPEDNRVHLWVMAAEVCQGFAFQMSFMGLNDEAATFAFLQDLAAVHAQIENELQRPSIMLPNAVSNAARSPRIM